MVDFWGAKFLVNFSQGKIGFKFVTETSPHSSHRSSQEANNLSPRAHSGAISHNESPDSRFRIADSAPVSFR